MPLDASFRIEDGSFGHIDEDGVFTPSGLRGGITWVEARVGALVKRAMITIVIEWVQNGADAVDPGAPGASGGYAGVGGEDPGGPVGDALRKTLASRSQIPRCVFCTRTTARYSRSGCSRRC